MTSTERMRIDKWLWVARFFKTRSLAATTLASNKIKCNGEHVKPARELKSGDRLEITIGQNLYVVIVQGMAAQRRPAPEARLLYEETPESQAERIAQAGIKEAGPRARRQPQGPPDQARRAPDPWAKGCD